MSSCSWLTGARVGLFWSSNWTSSSELQSPVHGTYVLSPKKGLFQTYQSVRIETKAVSPTVPFETGPEYEHNTKLAAWKSIQQERWEGELVVEGNIPQWLRGTYLRNGPGIWHLGEHEFCHMFDGFSTIVRLRFEDGRVTASHRQLESEAYKEGIKNNKVCYREFGESPKLEKKNFLSYLGEFVRLFTGASLTDNANIEIVKLGDGRVMCLTETIKGSILINPDTLETIGKFEYTDKWGGFLQTAHPIVTETEFLTLLPDFINPGYVVVRMKPGTNERKVIGRVKCRGGPGPGWVHSFPVTEHYVIVPEMPLRYCLGNLLRNEPAPLYKFEWYPESKAFMHVMCKANGNIVASVEVPNHLTFHYINAYEVADEQGKLTTIIADCCEYNADTNIFHKMRMDHLRSLVGDGILPDARVGRFTIPLDASPTGTLQTILDPRKHGKGVDMPTINPVYRGKMYRYAYATCAKRPCNYPNTLAKIDLVEKTVKKWHVSNVVPSEPFFVARPGATKEDDGVIISIISDDNGGGYAVLFDASTFEEIARAKFPYGLPHGFHGCWVPMK